MTTKIISVSPTQSAIQVNDVDAVVIGERGIISGLGKNKIINGNFAVNQRAVSGSVVLAAGVYGHDRFKAGAAGCTYTFATALGVTTLTITAGSLQQVIEGNNLQSGPVVLGWAGTAQGKIDAGAYGATGVTGTAIGGTNMTVEFNTGTLSLVQLETGSVRSYFEQRPYGMELALCQRYYYRITAAYAYQAFSIGWIQSPTAVFGLVTFPVPMRSAPAALEQSGTGSQYSAFMGASALTCNAVPTFNNGTPYNSTIVFNFASTGTVGIAGIIRADNNTTAYLGWSAEL